MKLAEALSLRADLQKRASQLKSRLKDNSKVQDGDEPAENIEDLFAELNGTLSQLEDLIYRINETNSHTLHNGENLTRIMARKDMLTLRVSLMRDVLDYAADNDIRFGRNEVRTVRLVNVAELRKETDNYARQLRELDLEIQGLNWTTDLL